MPSFIAVHASRSLRAVLPLAWSVFFAAVLPGVATGQDPVAAYLDRLPATVEALADVSDHDAAAAADNERAESLVQWVGAAAWSDEPASPRETLRRLERLLDAHRRIESAADRHLALRAEIAGVPEETVRRRAALRYLQVSDSLFDTSGRIRYLLRDAVDRASYALDADLDDFHALLALLTRYECQIGAIVTAFVLFDPPADSGAVPYPAETRRHLLALLRAARSRESVPDLAQYFRTERDPALVVEAVEVLLHIGVPQDPHPLQPEDAPEPAITAAEVVQRLHALRLGRRASALVTRRNRLLAELEPLAARGIAAGDTYRVGRAQVRSGDWLLMRNPSPYNRFTDLSPGMFTHVGVVAEHVDENGHRRMVLVDLPERGNRIPVTNLEVYLERTLHYVFLRHRDAGSAAAMGQAAATVIGNESQFDLTFRTDRVFRDAEVPLAERLIHTYCAGFLLVCAQEAGLKRQGCFPLTEFPAGGHCRANLSRLGISLGEDFVSPTGALFSTDFSLVSRSEAMYEPGREVREATFDHFAQLLQERELDFAPDLRQQLVQQIARLSVDRPWLAQALARANNVSEHLDLEAAARTAAVVDTLDEIADRNMDAFYAARTAVTGRAPPGEADPDAQALRQRHADLVAAWRSGRLTPRDIRRALVTYYSWQARRELESRLFGEPE